MRNRLLFVLFLVFFTVFGGGRSEHWSIACRDKQGWTYEVDVRSIEVSEDDVVTLRVKSLNGSARVIRTWHLNVEANTLQVEQEPVQTIGQGSVASQVILHLRERGVLNPTSVEHTL